jgi:hypothetical protein
VPRNLTVSFDDGKTTSVSQYSFFTVGDTLRRNDRSWQVVEISGDAGDGRHTYVRLAAHDGDVEPDGR